MNKRAVFLIFCDTVNCSSDNVYSVIDRSTINLLVCVGNKNVQIIFSVNALDDILDNVNMTLSKGVSG
jgi:hypothetical protein